MHLFVCWSASERECVRVCVRVCLYCSEQLGTMGQRRCQSQTELWGVGGPEFGGVWAQNGTGRGAGGGGG